MQENNSDVLTSRCLDHDHIIQIERAERGSVARYTFADCDFLIPVVNWALDAQGLTQGLVASEETFLQPVANFNVTLVKDDGKKEEGEFAGYHFIGNRPLKATGEFVPKDTTGATAQHEPQSDRVV